MNHNTERFRRGASEKTKKGESEDFPSEIFCLTVPRNAVGESFSLSLISCIRKDLVANKFMDKREGEVPRYFSVENI